MPTLEAEAVKDTLTLFFSIHLPSSQHQGWRVGGRGWYFFGGKWRESKSMTGKKDPWESGKEGHKAIIFFSVFCFLSLVRLQASMHSAEKTLLIIDSQEYWTSNFLFSGSSYFIKIIEESWVVLLMQVIFIDIYWGRIKIERNLKYLSAIL